MIRLPVFTQNRFSQPLSVNRQVGGVAGSSATNNQKTSPRFGLKVPAPSEYFSGHMPKTTVLKLFGTISGNDSDQDYYGRLLHTQAELDQMNALLKLPKSLLASNWAEECYMLIAVDSISNLSVAPNELSFSLWLNELKAVLYLERESQPGGMGVSWYLAKLPRRIPPDPTIEDDVPAYITSRATLWIPHL